MNKTALFFPPVYIAITLLGYFFGPWNFLNTDGYFSIYLFACLIFMVFGIIVGGSVENKSIEYNYKIDPIRFFRLSLFLNIIIAIPTTYARTGNIIPDLIFGLNNPAEAYQRSIISVFPQIEYIRIIFSPILFCAFPLGIACWRKLKFIEKFLFFIMVIQGIAMFISMGVNRGIFDAILGGGFIYMISRGNENKYLWKKIRKFLIIGVPVFGLALIFFAYGQLTREGSGAPIGYFPAADIYSSLNPLEASTDFIKYIYVLINQISIYLTQGYYGASLIFDRGISDFTFGFGNSDFIIRNMGKLFGDEFIASSAIYSIENENNWLHGNYWFSIIPWIASDVGFAGVPIVLFVLSYIYARSVQIYYFNGDWLSLVVVYLLFYLYLYFPANNYIVQSGEGLTAAWIFLLLWIFRGLVSSRLADESKI